MLDFCLHIEKRNNDSYFIEQLIYIIYVSLKKLNKK